MKRLVSTGLVLALAAGGGAFFASTRSLAPGVAAPDVAAARAFYADQPYYLQPLPFTEVPAGLPDLRSETCGGCHPDFYAEWLVSTHARAWADDPQFQEELNKSRTQKDRDVTWMCVNCHTPLENQLERLVVGLEGGDRGRPRYVDNPRFDRLLQQDAIGCATCHVRDGVVLGPYGDTQAPHPVRQAPELSTSQVCTQCHEAQAVFAEIPLGCFFETGAEWEAGPYAGQTCQSCHMPQVTRSLGPGGPERSTRRHWFGGSLLPKRPQDEAGVAPLRARYPEGAALGWVNLPEAVAAGRPVELRFHVTNVAAGHRLPTGDPERHLIVEAVVRDAAGVELARRSETIGAKYEWDPIRLVRDDRLAPGERRELTLSVTPTHGPLQLELIGSKWRMHAKDFDYHHLEGRYVRGRVFAELRAELPVR